MPAAARGTGPAAAEAFARYYVDLINYGAATGNTGRLSRVSGAPCRSCTAIVGNIQKIYRSGGKIDTRGWRILSADTARGRLEGQWVSTVRIREAAEHVVTRRGRLGHFFKGGVQTMAMYMTRSHATWSVDRLDLVA
jgi:uncharacterized protein DUF6318